MTEGTNTQERKKGLLRRSLGLVGKGLKYTGKGLWTATKGVGKGIRGTYRLTQKHVYPVLAESAQDFRNFLDEERKLRGELREYKERMQKGEESYNKRTTELQGLGLTPVNLENYVVRNYGRYVELIESSRLPDGRTVLTDMVVDTKEGKVINYRRRV